MARLVILSEGQKGRTYELQPGVVTTVGRVEDNAFQIAEGSVSSHHAEVIARETDVLIRDLNSTNGTFINGNQITGEAPLKPGQTLRFGQVELRMEASLPPVGSASSTKPAASSQTPAPQTKKALPDQTMIIPQGVKLGQDHGGGTKPDLGKGFAKKSNVGTKIFIGAAIVAGIVIVVLIAMALSMKPGGQ
jgi:pSer/pThr/pTyr-binding forkhead associated (FHA) protein